MQKKIIALAIASAMTMPALALAEATVYGQANMALEMTDSGDKTPGADATTNSISSNASRLGLKGSEDLGDGLTMVWQMEGTVGMDNGTASTALFDRNTFAGLAGGFGTVVLGQHDTPYKLATRGLDVFADTIADNRSMMGGGTFVQGLIGITHDARLSDVVAYISPNFNGVSIAAAYHGGSDSMSLLGNYAAGPLSVSLGYQDVLLQAAGLGVAVKSTGVKSHDAIATKLGGSYTMDAFTVGLAYEMLSLKPVTGNKTDQDNIYISGKYNVSDKGAVKLAYTMAGESKTGGVTATDSANQLAVGYDHSLTKNTTLYALYTAVSNDTGASYGLNSAGSTASANVVTAGEDPSAIAVGVRHSF